MSVGVGDGPLPSERPARGKGHPEGGVRGRSARSERKLGIGFSAPTVAASSFDIVFLGLGE